MRDVQHMPGKAPAFDPDAALFRVLVIFTARFNWF